MRLRSNVMSRAASLRFFSGVLALLSGGCSVYDPSLLGNGGAGSSGDTSTSGSSSDASSSSGMACTSPSMCPGMDDECGTRTCNDGGCGLTAEMEGKALAEQTAGDCKKNVCNGSGSTTVQADAADPPDDGKECTTDSCVGNEPMSVAKTNKTPCTQAGGKMCFDTDCVECVDPGDCASGVCTMQHTCGAATCTDMIKNGMESDTDCGGTCNLCANGKHCNSAADCVSSSCSGTFCQPSCTDLMKNQDETDTDCGGTSCGGCDLGKTCAAGADCLSGVCGPGNVCACGTTHLVISEVRTKGPNTANDDFVELYNPTQAAVTLDSTWILEARSEAAGTYEVRWTGAGQVLPPGRHFLIGGTTYADPVAKDASLATGITDEVSVVLRKSGVVVDALCIYCGTNSFSTHVCEGAPFEKTGCSTSGNYASAERKTGGAQGNCQDTDMNPGDFIISNPSNPQNLASAPTP